ncbi:hypothetical protein L226DRAFT_529165 [Lentinus tigrinus ALCF2SS1-7]|uniref:Uncharacterized protein n=1 Tax=Lentinus tigrinus ALCF2SS1-6 TaxID=1328759 RepID=A0A5C2SSY4_9APHY|nr:hypothetical protein L227DRAFT_568981 [Lentinus tigrinus ALCF2SS1-6]RPD80704.1 hypothetical protein L226DRAFT_529165 [Lentinus tigrinus ALCF2SS1-7]
MAVADAPNEPPISELQVLHGELAVLMTGVGKFQHQLRQVTQAVDERTRLLQIKVEELEAQNLSRALEIRQLEQENEELHQVLEAKIPELANVIQERNDALMELHNARKVIEDLLRHRECYCQAHLEDPPEEATRTARKQVTLVPAKKLQHPTRENLVESDDESTVRPARSIASVNTALTVARAPPAGTDGVSRKTNPARTSSQETDASASTAADSPRTRTTSTSKKRLSWYLEFDKRPGTSSDVFHGPIPFDILSDNLVLEEDVVNSICSLEYEAGYDIRIHTDADLAFVYRPVVLEGLTATYLIGWGDPSTMRRWLKDVGEVNLFFYPPIDTSRAGWFFLGKHKLTYAPIESVWSKLPREDKERLFVELKDRNPDMNVSQFRRDVREGRLVQYCIQLENVGKVESLDFLREYGLLPGDGRIA